MDPVFSFNSIPRFFLILKYLLMPWQVSLLLYTNFTSIRAGNDKYHVPVRNFCIAPRAPVPPCIRVKDETYETVANIVYMLLMYDFEVRES
jgi:hypothetical protein